MRVFENSASVITGIISDRERVFDVSWRSLEGFALLTPNQPYREKTSIGMPKPSRRRSASGKKRLSASVRYVSC